MPLVPVTVTVYWPAAAAVQDSVAVWGDAPKVTLAGRVQVSPGEAENVRVTVPVKPFSAVRVMVEVPGDPADIWGLGDTAPAAMLKSVTCQVIVTVLTMDPLVPVTVTA